MLTPDRPSVASAASAIPNLIPDSSAVLDMLAIASVWCVTLLIVNPVGDFPLNDDWSYGLAVKRLVELGDYRPTGWTSMPLISQALWGALFCLPAGFSFNALRLSTLVLSLLGIFGLYLLLRHIQSHRWIAISGALALGFNPIYYALSNTFMTDVPFTALVILASLFFVRSLQNGSDRDLLIGSALAIAATLCRQLGLFVPFAFAPALLVKRGFTGRSVVRAVAPFALSVVALVFFQHWLAATGRLPVNYSSKSEEVLRTLSDPRDFVPRFAWNTWVALLYAGWFSLPLLVLGLPNAWPSTRSKLGRLLPNLLGAGFILLSMVVIFRKGYLMPMVGDIVVTQGIGPLTVHDYYVPGLPDLPQLPKGLWLMVTAMSVLGGSVLIAAAARTAIELVRRLRRAEATDNHAVSAFLTLGVAAYFLPILALGFFDRYFITILPFLMAVVVLFGQRGQPRLAIRISIAALLIAVFAFFAVCGTRDYLTWNRLRWQALNELQKVEGITPKEVDGGFEFNGWHLYDPNYQTKPGKSWWWVDQDKYLIALRYVPGSKIIKEDQYSHWMPPYTGRVLVLEQEPRQSEEK